MDLNNLLDTMTPEIYQRLITAVELGKWADGSRLTAEQRENSLQVVMLWQARHNNEPQHMTVGTDGKIKMKSKQELKSLFDNDRVATLKPLDD